MQGVGLCHGISGNAYALLSAHRMTGDARRLRQASQFGAFMAQHWAQLLSVPDRPLSLFEACLISAAQVAISGTRLFSARRALPGGAVEAFRAIRQRGWTWEGAHNSILCNLQGLGGAVCFWADMMDPPDARFPGYEL